MCVCRVVCVCLFVMWVCLFVFEMRDWGLCLMFCLLCCVSLSFSFLFCVRLTFVFDLLCYVVCAWCVVFVCLCVVV